MKRFLLALLALVLSSTAHARNPQTEAMIKTCIAQAAETFHIPALPIEILRDVEAGEVGRVSKNDNGSYDIGPMQINSSWLPTLAAMGISESALRDNACVNAYVGTWIYYQAWRETGNVAQAMARYHSPYSRFQARYLGLVLQAIDRRTAQSAPSVASR
ncbi:MAG TPA: lytic transglycosylase domain-containing protein [Rhodanobacteraceae bacterium]|nr:lytic transglycosylase domain-containing protein [Rhodanobacteraceae bacterium]